MDKRMNRWMDGWMNERVREERKEEVVLLYFRLFFGLFRVSVIVIKFVLDCLASPGSGSLHQMLNCGQDIKPQFATVQLWRGESGLISMAWKNMLFINPPAYHRS
jgi:hypothetical protein